MATFIKDAVKVFIARENIIDMSSFTVTNGVLSDLGASRLSTTPSAAGGVTGGSLSTTRVYYEISDVTGVSIGGHGKEFDTFQSLADPYDHDIEIKMTGSGSCDFIMKETSGHSGSNDDWDHMLLKGLAYELPNGWNSTSSNDPIWDPTDDNDVPASFTGGVPATDERGYAVVVQQQISTSSYLHWVYHNCKIGCSISFANRQASRGTFTWDDARFVQFFNLANYVNETTSYDAHVDSATTHLG
jgi:hypothetical protein|tara:strand:- start:60 stop:791 length:732 start_codon:yes stop_codon:yes gene_type:complete